MSSADIERRRQRTEDILADLLEDAAHGNDVQYFWASDIADEDPELTATMVGTHLSNIDDEWTLSTNLEVEQYTQKQGGASLWIVRTNGEG